MSSKKITDLTAQTVMATGDLLFSGANPGGSLVMKSITRANFLGGTNIVQVVGTTESQTITTKTLDNTNTITLKGTKFTLQDDTDTSKQLRFLMSSITTATIRTITMPDASGTVTLQGNTTTGSGNIVLATSPTLTTPILGAATATTINKITLTAPASAATITITNNKTLAVTNTLTLSGTDSTVMTFPSTTATIARIDAAQTFTGTQTFSQINTTNNAIAASGNAATVPITSRLNTVTNNSAATLTITMTTTSAVDGQVSIVRILDSSAATQTITWVNTENSQTNVPTTSNGSTTLPLTVGFMYNSATSKWRCIAYS